LCWARGWVAVVEPRVCSFPPFERSRVGEALELADRMRMKLDDWQVFVLERALGVRPDGKWAARDVAVVVPRQNGKNAILEVRELAGVLRFGEGDIIHSAHRADTAVDVAKRRTRSHLDAMGLVEKRDFRAAGTHGQERIEFTTGGRILFRTRANAGGRGFSADCVVLDEAFEIQERFYGDLYPVVSARDAMTVSGPQVWHTGSAVDQEVHDHGVVLARLRERALAGGDPELAYFEWSADVKMDDVDADVLDDRARWAEANPGFPVRVSERAIAAERRGAMGSRRFAVERLGVGDWPATEETAGSVLDVAKWDALVDGFAERAQPVAFAFDVKPNREFASIAAAWRRPDGLVHVEVVDHAPRTGWLVKRLRDLSVRYEAGPVWCDAAGPANSMLRQLEEEHVRVETTSARDLAAACGLMFDLVEEQGLRHSGHPELREAVESAATRPLGDAWAWSRRRSGGSDISPLVAASIAVWRAAGSNQSVYERRGLLVV
jgi:hypothetical protein